jgi:hypothetical protein
LPCQEEERLEATKLNEAKIRQARHVERTNYHDEGQMKNIKRANKSFALLIILIREQKNNKDAASQVYLQIEIARLHLSRDSDLFSFCHSNLFQINNCLMELCISYL